MTILQLLNIENNFPPILSLIEDYPQHTLRFDISADLHWFEGHFPDAPVLAGVVQLHWAVGVSMTLYQFSEGLVEGIGH